MTSTPKVAISTRLVAFIGCSPESDVDVWTTLTIRSATSRFVARDVTIRSAGLVRPASRRDRRNQCGRDANPSSGLEAAAGGAGIPDAASGAGTALRNS